MKKRIICFTSAIVIFLLVGGIVLGLNNTQKKVKADTVTSVIQEMSDIVDRKMEEDPLVGLSSNPYAYIEDNEAYDALKDMGVEKVPEMLDYLKNSKENGLKEYLIAIAIEDNLNTNLKETEDYDWQDGKSFYTQLSNVLDNRKKIIEAEVKKSDNTKELKENIEPYGKIAEECIVDNGISIDKFDYKLEISKQERKVIKNELCK